MENQTRGLPILSFFGQFVKFIKLTNRIARDDWSSQSGIRKGRLVTWLLQRSSPQLNIYSRVNEWSLWRYKYMKRIRGKVVYWCRCTQDKGWSLRCVINFGTSFPELIQTMINHLVFSSLASFSSVSFQSYQAGHINGIHFLNDLIPKKYFSFTTGI